MSDLRHEEVVEACEMNYIDYWRSATAATAGEWSEEGGIERCVTGLPQEIFNVVLRCHLADDVVETRMDNAINEFRARNIPMIWHVGLTTSPKNLGSYLEKRGFPHDYDLVAMAADTSHEPGAAPSRDIAVKTCHSDRDIEAWIDCLTRSWDSPAQVGLWMRKNPFFSDPTWHSPRHFSRRVMYLGLKDGAPCGAVMLLTSGGVSGLQCVGTVSEARRKGVGEALVRSALRDASLSGHGFVVVLSTTEGVPLYIKTGFRGFGTLPEHSLYFDREKP